MYETPSNIPHKSTWYDMKNLDNSSADTTHSTNADETDEIYEQFLKSMGNLELETDDDKQDDVDTAVVPPSALSSDDSPDSFALSLDSLDSPDSDGNSSSAHDVSVDNSVDNNAPLFAEIDLEESSALAPPPSTIVADDSESADNPNEPIDNADSLRPDDLITDTSANLAATDIGADNAQDSVSVDAAVETVAAPKSLLGRFKKPKLSKALREKPTRTKTPKKDKASKKDSAAPKTKKTTKAPKNRTMLIILGGLLVTLGLVSVLISTDILSSFTDEQPVAEAPATISPEASNPEALDTAETTDASAAPDTPAPDSNQITGEQIASDDTSAAAVAGSGVDELDDSAKMDTENRGAAEATPTSAEGIPEAQNSLMSYEEFTEAADITLYRDTKE